MENYIFRDPEGIDQKEKKRLMSMYAFEPTNDLEEVLMYCPNPSDKHPILISFRPEIYKFVIQARRELI